MNNESILVAFYLHALYFISLFMTQFPLRAETYTNKTYLSLRPINYNIPLEETLWRRSLEDYEKEKEGSVELTPLSFFSKHGSDQGTYFFFGGSNKLTFGPHADIDHRFFKYNETSNDALVGTLEISPEIETYGLFASYYQKLTDLIPNTAFRIRVPLMYMISHCHETILGSPASENNKTVRDYFKGEAMWQTISKDSVITLQRPLEYGKIDNKPRAKLGVSALDFAFEWELVKDEKNTFFLTGHLLIPADNNTDAKWLFEPILGTGNHFALGAEIEDQYALSTNWKIIANARWFYTFPSIERRLLGLKDGITGDLLNFSPYLLIGKIGFPFVEPAANILAHFVRVSPQNQLEANLLFSYKHSGVIFEGGYNIFLRQQEHVKRKSSFDENTYAFVGSNFASQLLPLDSAGNPTTNVLGSTNTNPFNLFYSTRSTSISHMSAAGTSPTTQGAITSSQIDTSVATTPSVFNNSLFVAAGYTWDFKKSAVSFGAGYSIDFPFNNAALLQNTFWLKMNAFF